MTSSATSPGATAISNGSLESNVFGAFGAVLGYIGAEAATVLSFEQLLWPQRFYSYITLRSAPKLALFSPMGGPLHKAALKTMDAIFDHGLLQGSQQGHVLGTPFFRALDWSYTMHGDETHQSHTEPLRNCIWAHALTYLGAHAQVLETGAQSLEKAQRAPARPVRAKGMVSHLTLSAATAADKTSELPFVAEGVGTPSLRVFLAIITAEIPAVLAAIGLVAAYHTWWASFWVAPLFLRLASAFFSLRREPLISLSSSSSEDPSCDFEVHCPQSQSNFMLITGPPILVLQFMRHYGHPVRSRFREVVQLLVVVAFASLFPLGLLCSMIWMPVPVQNIWLCYQLFTVLTMHVARYSFSGTAATTEARIAELLGKEAADGERALLFGHERSGHGTIKASLIATHHARYQEGKDCVARLLRRPRAMPAA